jgi:hypothetical protein
MADATLQVRERPWTPPVARAEGFALFTALEALLKGSLECEQDVHVLLGPRRQPFEPVFRAAESSEVAETLARHGMAIVPSQDAARAVTLLGEARMRGQGAVALLPNDQLDGAMPALARTVGARALHPDHEVPSASAGLGVLVMEDNPYAVPTTCPRRVCRRVGIPTVEPWDVRSLRDSVDAALRLSRATGRPAAIIAHTVLLRSADTLEAFPNRQVARVDHEAWLRRRRSVRPVESVDALRTVRRLELNRLDALPSPGEREMVGFVAVGPCWVAVQHMLAELGLAGRLPVLRIGATDPLDDSGIVRLLERCESAIVVEPRPGSVAPRIVSVAERLRATGSHAAAVWWDSLPPEAQSAPIGVNEGLRTSILTRRLIGLLRHVRPGLHVEERLAQLPEWAIELDAPRRAASYGLRRAMELAQLAVRRAAEELAASPNAQRRSIGMEGIEWSREGTVCAVELWDRARFAVEGIAAVRQACRQEGPRAILLCDLQSDDQPDPELIARAAVPAVGGRRLEVVRVDLHDADALRDSVAEAALRDCTTLIIARDGPPSRVDIASLDRAAAEIDRSGYSPAQRVVWPADAACELQQPSIAALLARGLAEGSDPLPTEPVVVRLDAAPTDGVVLRIEPLLEQVEVVRSRPPQASDALRAPLKVPPPRLLHAAQGLWRAHLAGVRGESPGAAALMLAEAGRTMGFRVQWLTLPVALAPGRKAWTQISFTALDAPAEGDFAVREATEESDIFTAQIPYGEADVVIGADAVECVRALGPDPQLRVASPDRTAIVANGGMLDDQINPAQRDCAERLQRLVDALAMEGRGLVVDAAAACRRIFLADRGVDVVVLGAAYQLGLVPVSIESLESAAVRLEARGISRAYEAFQLGRLLAARAAGLPMGDVPVAILAALESPAVLGSDDDEDESEPSLLRTASASASARGVHPMTGRLARRAAAERRAGRRRASEAARRLRNLIESTLGPFEATAAQREGAATMRLLATALQRAEIWGGIAYARRMAEIVQALVATPGPDGGLRLASTAVLPLAESMLIRDIWYLARASTSIAQRRRVREALGVRSARGDEIRRRYLNRLEVGISRWRWRVEFRSSDWPERLVRIAARAVPLSLRGDPERIAARDMMIRLLSEAAATRDPERLHAWRTFARAMRAAAHAGRLRSMTAEEIEAQARRTGAVES